MQSIEQASNAELLSALTGSRPAQLLLERFGGLSPLARASLEELQQLKGVGKGKAQKFGQPFIELIGKYTKENDIERPIDFVVKSAGHKSTHKVQIIQNIDKRIPLPDIARGLGKSMTELIDELEALHPKVAAALIPVLKGNPPAGPSTLTEH